MCSIAELLINGNHEFKFVSFLAHETTVIISLLEVVALWGDCMFNVYSGRLGVIVTDLGFVAKND
jgi:hypothetical protein